MPTIRSRCQTIRFNPLPVNDIPDLVLTLGWTESPDEARAAAEISGGSLTVAQQVDPQLQAVRKALFVELEKGRLEPFTIGRTLLEALDGLGGDTQAQTHQRAVWIVRFAVEFLQTKIRAASREYPAEVETTEGLARAIEQYAMPRNRSTRTPRFLCASRRWRATWHASWPRPRPQRVTPNAADGEADLGGHGGYRDIPRALRQRPRITPTTNPKPCTRLRPARYSPSGRMTYQPIIQKTIFWVT